MVIGYMYMYMYMYVHSGMWFKGGGLNVGGQIQGKWRMCMQTCTNKREGGEQEFSAPSPKNRKPDIYSSDNYTIRSCDSHMTLHSHFEIGCTQDAAQLRWRGHPLKILEK